MNLNYIYEGWMTKAGANYSNWRERYARVFREDNQQLILAYYPSESSTKEKGRLLLSQTLTYFCCSVNNHATVYIILPARTWIFSYKTEKLRTMFVDICLDKSNEGRVVKDGWLSHPSTPQSVLGGMMSGMMKGNSGFRRHCVILDSGFVLQHTKHYGGYVGAFDVRATSSIVAKEEGGLYSLILTCDPFEVALAAYVEKKDDMARLEANLAKLESKGDKLKRIFSQQDVSAGKQETSEKNYKKYMKRWNATTTALSELNQELLQLEDVMAKSKDEQVTTQVWHLLSEVQGGAGYLLGPKAELSSWLLALEDSRDGTNNSMPIGRSKRTSTKSKSKSVDKNTKRSETSEGSRLHRKRNKHKREKREKRAKKSPTLMEDNNEDNEEDNEDIGSVDISGSLPDGWGSAEFVHPKTKKRQSYFFHQASTGGTSTTWERPTESYQMPAETKKETNTSTTSETSAETSAENQSKQYRSRRLSKEGRTLFKQSINLEESGGIFSGQKCGGTSREASKEAEEWSNGKTLREMLLKIHHMSYLVKEPVLSNGKMDDDPEVELKRVQKSYRKAIRQLHPDRTCNRDDVSDYEKSLGSSLFSLLKGKMTDQ